MTERPHRPALFADLTAMIDAAGGVEPGSRAELASATALAVVSAGRLDEAPTGDERDRIDVLPTPSDGEAGATRERFVSLADVVGLDTLAALWRGSDPVSLPGALWALYLLREWCRTAGDEVTRLWRAGEALAPADAVVAGVADYADVAAVQASADAVLNGVYGGDLAVALERAAALFRVVAAGRRALDEGPASVERAERNERVAASLSAAARRWRAGTLR